MDREFWNARAEARRHKSPEERQLDALEDIADYLIMIEEQLGRIADNGPAVAG